MTQMRLFCSVALAAGLALSAGAAQAVTIVNGGFETGATVDGNFITLNTGSTAIDGWVVGGLGVDWIHQYWQPKDGERSIDLAGTDKGSVMQTLSGLVIGQVYQVDFWLAGNPDGGGSIKTAVVSDGGSQASVYNFLQTGNTRANMGWQREVFRFTAVDTTADLVFSATLNNPYGPALDNVSITAVPEPATWALMILGFGAAGAALRRRREALIA